MDKLDFMDITLPIIRENSLTSGKVRVIDDMILWLSEIKDDIVKNQSQCPHCHEWYHKALEEKYSVEEVTKFNILIQSSVMTENVDMYGDISYHEHFIICPYCNTRIVIDHPGKPIITNQYYKTRD